MYKEIEVNNNLYHLLNVLSDLHRYSFDSDITKMLNDLSTLVDKKLWPNGTFDGFDIKEEKLIIKFLLEK